MDTHMHNATESNLGKDHTLAIRFSEWKMEDVDGKRWYPSRALYLIDKDYNEYIVRATARKNRDSYFASVTLVNPEDETEGWHFCRDGFPTEQVALEQVRVEIEKNNHILQVFGAGEFLHDAIGNGLRWM